MSRYVIAVHIRPVSLHGYKYVSFVNPSDEKYVKE
jgi:hypothetical protein